MKKRAIIFGSLISVFLLLIVPNISAIKYREMKEDIQSNTNLQLQTMMKHIGEIKQGINNFKNNLNLLLTILIRGIILPILFDFIYTVIVLSIRDAMPIISKILSWICYSIMDNLFYTYTLKKMIEETGRVLISLILSFILVVFDNKVTDYLINDIFYD